MDQLFAFLKSIIEENLKELYKRLFRQLEGRIPDDNEQQQQQQQQQQQLQQRRRQQYDRQ